MGLALYGPSSPVLAGTTLLGYQEQGSCFGDPPRPLCCYPLPLLMAQGPAFALGPPKAGGPRGKEHH